MTANIYEAVLNGAEDVTVTAGIHSLTMHFVWNSVMQGLYDDVTRRVTDMASSDPLMADTIVRDYDWIDYYLNTVPDVSEIEVWLTTDPVLPQSVTLRPATVSKVECLVSNKELASEIQSMLVDCADRLYWQCRIVDESGDVTVCDVVNGATFRNQDTSWAIQFSSDKEVVGPDDLSFVTVTVEVYDE